MVLGPRKVWWLKQLGLIEKGKLLIDVGFNIGSVGIFAGAFGMRVIGFEPVLANWQVASQSVWLNGLQGRVRIYHRAVHWKKGPMR